MWFIELMLNFNKKIVEITIMTKGEERSGDKKRRNKIKD